MGETPGGMVLGTIDMKPDKPLLRILHKRGTNSKWDEMEPGVRPCSHPHLLLDERWATVTCADCKERVDAFAALMRYAEIHEEMERKAERLEHRECQAWRALLRTTEKRRHLTDEERKEVRRAIQNHSMPASDLAAIHQRYDRPRSPSRPAAVAVIPHHPGARR